MSVRSIGLGPRGLRGPKGDKGDASTVPGPKGADGATWTLGAGAPTATANPNDLYLDTTTGDVYRNN